MRAEGAVVERERAENAPYHLHSPVLMPPSFSFLMSPAAMPSSLERGGEGRRGMERGGEERRE
jgi:hypothetical protein